MAGILQLTPIFSFRVVLRFAHLICLIFFYIYKRVEESIHTIIQYTEKDESDPIFSETIVKSLKKNFPSN